MEQDIQTKEVRSRPGWNFRDLRKSVRDKKITGVCGALGEYTPIPSWLWRVAFFASVFVGGLGLIAYLILWVCMPSAKEDQ